MNNAQDMAEIIRQADRRNAPEAMETLMAQRKTVAIWVSDVLAEIKALRGLLADVANARDVREARTLAAKAADVPMTEDPRVAANKARLERRKAEAELEARIAAEKAKREKADRLEAAKRELAKIEAERRRESELRAFIAAADGAKEPPAVDAADFHIEH